MMRDPKVLHLLNIVIAIVTAFATLALAIRHDWSTIVVPVIFLLLSLNGIRVFYQRRGRR